MERDMNAWDKKKLDEKVLEILHQGAYGRGNRPHGMTVYQVLDRMPDGWFNELTENGKHVGGKGGGDSAKMVGTQHIQRSLARLADGPFVDFFQVDAKGMSFAIKGKPVQPSYEVTTFYYLLENKDLKVA
jgi:hypothetical protein